LLQKTKQEINYSEERNAVHTHSGNSGVSRYCHMYQFPWSTANIFISFSTGLTPIVTTTVLYS